MIQGTGLFFDQIVFHPRDELALATQRTYADGLSSVTSLRGRAVCLWRVGTHAVGIFVKPVYYAVMALAKKVGLYLEHYYPRFYWAIFSARQEDPIDPADHEFYRRHRWEFYNVWQSRHTELGINGLAAPISQAAQLFRAVCGVVHPGCYFKEDELAICFREFAAAARAVDCPRKLIERLDRGSQIVRESIAKFPNPEYYSAQILQDLVFIRDKFRQPDFPQEKKLALLLMLNPEPKGAGIEACPGGLGRTLQQMRGNLEIPAQSERVIPWLAGQLKGEILNQMVMQAEGVWNRNRNQCTEWQKIIVQRTAHDTAHRGNALILAIGNRIGLPREMIERVKHDPTLLKIPELAAEKSGALIAAFRQFYTKSVLANALVARINSQPDGSPGLKPFREHVIQKLSTIVTAAEIENEDETFFVIQKYYLHGGNGNPSDPQYTDLKPEAIVRYAETLGENNPFAETQL